MQQTKHCDFVATRTVSTGVELPTNPSSINFSTDTKMTTTTTTSTGRDNIISEPFRFLDLLAEQERIPVPVRVAETHFEQPLEDKNWEPVTYTIITQSTTALAILSMCLQIYCEASKDPRR